MSKYLGIDIKAILAKVVGPKVDSLTFYKAFGFTRTTGSLTSGRNVEVEAFACKGYVARNDDYDMYASLVNRGDKKIVILAGTLDETVTPDADDYVTDSDGQWYTIVAVKNDSSDAEYILEARETDARTVLIRLTLTNDLLWNIE